MKKSGHLAVLKPDGEPLRTPSGVPVHFSGSPSDYRATRNAITRLRRSL